MNIPKRTIAIAAGVAAAFMAGVANGAITGSEHDFSGETWNASGEICVVCHTPHNAITAADAPLWNHETTVASFDVYASGTFDGSASIGQPAGSSIMCLSCHDGTVAVDNFGAKTNGSEFVTGDHLIGTDLRNDHPISFTYDSTLASTDGSLYDPTTTVSGIAGSTATIDADMLISGRMQCSSCHDVHDSAGIPELLVKSNAASGLCLTCHNK